MDKKKICLIATGGKIASVETPEGMKPLLDGKELLAKGEDGILGLTISNAIHLSAWTGETIDVKNFSDDRFYEELQDKIRNSTVVKKESQIVVDNSNTY